MKRELVNSSAVTASRTSAAWTSSTPRRTVHCGLKAGRSARNLLAAHPVAAHVGAAVRRVRDPAVGDDLLHDLGNLAHLVVLRARPDVERLVVDGVARRRERRLNGEADVADVDERPPGRPVAHDRDLAGRRREPDQVVHDHVAAEPRRVAVCGRVAEVDGAERRVGELRQVSLREHLRLAVGVTGSKSAFSSSSSSPFVP